MLHVLLCTERLLFRFGADRVLCLIGQRLHEAGHRVTVLANRHDQASVAGWADRVIEVATAPDYLRGNEHTSALLAQHWRDWFATGEPDVAIIGGWPFFGAISLLQARGVPTVFFDCGAVPTDGLTGGALEVQLELRRQRRRHLPAATVIAPISEFLARSQSLPDGSGVPVHTILLGADHLERGLWRHGGISSAGSYRRAEVDRAFAAGGPVVLNLGRWEPDNYKNGRALLPLLDALARRHPNVRALVLADPAELALPPAYAKRIVAVGSPDDGELEELMRRVDLGVVLSRWEGFGLPLAEMQWLGRPVLAFAGHAHDEVALDPRYLCQDEDELARKATAILDGGELAHVPPAATARFRAAFRWQRTLDAWLALVERVATGGSRPANIVIDATFACIDPGNSGVIRVTRQMSRALQASVNVWFVRWDHRVEGYVFPNEREYAQLGQFNGPLRSPTAIVSPPHERTLLADHVEALGAGPTWLCITETVAADVLARAQRTARAHGFRVAAVFYDAIPVLHPELVPDLMIRNNHADYMRELAGCDVVVPISRYSGDCLERFWADRGVPPTRVAPVLLAGEVGPASVAPVNTGAADRVVELLCVSTIEPRKNHERLLAACVALKQRRPDLRWRLRLVGNSYAGAEELARRVAAVCKQHAEIDYLGIVDDAELTRLYRRADFTVYPSLVEGFGLPIVESLAFGKPCICADTGVMAELAAEGGCLTVDVTDTAALSSAIETLIADRPQRATLAQQACRRRLRTWADHASDFLATLAAHGPVPRSASRPEALLRNGKLELDHALFPGCLHEGWQMNPSERIGLRGVLAHLRPRCAVEVGTYKGGSLSLIAQHARVVFSIDIEPMPPHVRVFDNVSFLTGPSEVVLPALLDELEAQDLAPDFVLVDADHSRAGVRRDLDLLIKRRVSRPLWIMMHDSINPDCRAGMLDVDWQASPWVHYVDLDFIPGRIIEHGGQFDGELWGGLGLVCMLPERRRGELEVRQTAIEMVRRLQDSAPVARPDEDSPSNAAATRR